MLTEARFDTGLHAVAEGKGCQLWDIKNLVLGSPYTTVDAVLAVEAAIKEFGELGRCGFRITPPGLTSRATMEFVCGPRFARSLRKAEPNADWDI